MAAGPATWGSSGDGSCSTDSLDDCLAELQKGSEPGLGRALLALGTQHTKETGDVARFRDRGGLEALLGLLTGALPSNSTLELALGVLEKCCTEEGSRTQVRELGGIPLLVTILKLLAVESIQNRTARALGNLAVDSENCQAIHESGAVPQLVQVLTTSQDSECLQSVIMAIRYLANSPAHRLLLAQQGAVRPITERLTSSRDDVALVTAAVRALAELSKGCSRDCAEQLSLGDGVMALVALAGHEKRVVEESALAVLANLCLQEVLSPAMASVGFVDWLVREIQRRRDSGAPAASLHLLLRVLGLLCQEAINRTQVRESGGLELLLSLLRDESHSALHARVVMAFMAFSNDEEALEVLQAGGLIPLLVDRVAAQGQPVDLPAKKPEHCWIDTDFDEEYLYYRWSLDNSRSYDLNPWWFKTQDSLFEPYSGFSEIDPEEDRFFSDDSHSELDTSLSNFLHCENRSWLFRESRSPVSPQWSPDTSLSELVAQEYVSPNQDLQDESLGQGSTLSHSRSESPDFFHSPILDLPLVGHRSVSEALNSTEGDGTAPDQDLCPPSLADQENLPLGPVQEVPKSNGKEIQETEQKELVVSELDNSEEEPSREDFLKLPCSSNSGTMSKPVTKARKGDAKVSLVTSQDEAGPCDSDSIPWILIPNQDDQSQLSPGPVSRSPDTEENAETLPESPLEYRIFTSSWKRHIGFSYTLDETPPLQTLRYTFQRINTSEFLRHRGGVASPVLLNLDRPFFHSYDGIKTELRAPEAPALLLLSRFSQAKDPSQSLVTPTTLQGLLRYITGSPTPSSRCFRLLHHLTCNPAYLEAFVRSYGPSLIRTWLVLGISPEEAAAIVAGEREEEGPSLYAEEQNPRRFKEMGEALLMNFYLQTILQHGKKFFANMLHFRCIVDQAACALAMPLICRKDSQGRKLLLRSSGLYHLLGALVQDPDPSFVFYVSDALSLLCSKAQKRHNWDPKPLDFDSLMENKRMAMWFYRFVRAKAGPRPPASTQHRRNPTPPCPYHLMLDERRYDVFFQLDSECFFPALRQAMSDASSVFHAMLARGFAKSRKATRKATVTLHDVSPEPFVALIHFIHGCRGKPCPIFGTSLPRAFADYILVVAECYLLSDQKALVDAVLKRDFFCPGTPSELVCQPPASKKHCRDPTPPCPYSLMVDEGRADLFFWLDSGCTISALRQAVTDVSEVFRAMLAGGFAESCQTTVTLHNVLPETFLALIHFLHGCRGKPCPILGKSLSLALAEDILVVAEQYLLPELQTLVDAALRRDFLHPGTLGELVCLAERQNRPRLLRNCAAYIFLQKGSTPAQRAATLGKLLRVVTNPSSIVTALQALTRKWVRAWLH